MEKTAANDNIINIYGHTIQKGSEFIQGYYLKKVDEKKGRVYYKELKKLVYVYPYEIFCPAVPINKDLSLTAEDYQFLSDSI